MSNLLLNLGVCHHLGLMTVPWLVNYFGYLLESFSLKLIVLYYVMASRLWLKLGLAPFASMLWNFASYEAIFCILYPQVNGVLS